MDVIRELLERDFTDPVNLIPLLIVAMALIYLIAILLDQPPR